MSFLWAARNDRAAAPTAAVRGRNRVRPKPSGLKFDQRGIWPLIGRPDLVANRTGHTRSTSINRRPSLRPPRRRAAADDDAIFGRRRDVTPFDRGLRAVVCCGERGAERARESLLPMRVPFAPSCLLRLAASGRDTIKFDGGGDTNTHNIRGCTSVFTINGFTHPCYISTGAAGRRTDTPPSCKQQSSASSYWCAPLAALAPPLGKHTNVRRQ